MRDGHSRCLGEIYTVSLQLSAVSIILFVLLFPAIVYASDISLEKDLQSSLEQSREIVNSRQQSAVSSQLNIDQLKSIAENIKASHSLFQQRF
ncbi:MAG: hypothetical protein HY754_15135, partial [Nitrospirae bacterium]|nr:hypothetical protein [Nitrospirota bacterium]